MLGQAVGWYLVVQILSLVTLPIALTVFQSLPGRGYAFAKPFSLLLGGYLFWLALSMHLLPNRPGSVAWVFIFLAAVSIYLVWQRKDEFVRQLNANAGFIVAVEIVFFFTFFVAAHLKSFIPEIVGTEKPMDFMMLNTASRSQYFPPDDPWLSGFAVSYYYFGYVIQAMVGKLSFVAPSVAFNLALVSTASLAATAAFGLGYELVSMARRAAFRLAIASGVVALVLVTLMGNLEGVIEFGVANGLNPAGSLVERVDIANLDGAKASDSCLVGIGACVEYPNDQSSFWWWWRATRISPDGNSITEFPFFSFLLGDLHPHVMAIPFVFTVIGLGLTLFRAGERLGFEFWRRRLLLLLVVSMMLGGLGFLNTWDLPTVAFLTGVLVLARNLIDRLDFNEGLRDTAAFMVPLLLLAFLLYLPFYAGFSSQAAGFEAVRDEATRPLHSALFWAPLLTIALALPAAVLHDLPQARSRGVLQTVLVLPGFLVILWFAALLSAGYSATDAIAARGWNWLTAGFLAAGLVATLMALWGAIEARSEAPGDDDDSEDKATGALDPALVPVLAMMATALLLILGAELFYVRDVFSSRLNTVFKLSYQAWLLLGVGGAYSLYWLFERWQAESEPVTRLARNAWSYAVVLLVAGALLYPLGATLSRTEGFGRPNRSLDGLAFVGRESPEEWSTVAWLRKHAGRDERLVEGTGNQYTTAGRMAAWTGVPSVLGWLGHEVQWGRSPGDIGTRQQDVDTIYTSPSLGDVLPLLQKYGVTYVMVGSLETAKYPADGLRKFQDLTPSFRSGNTTIYRVPPPLAGLPLPAPPPPPISPP